MQKVREKGKLLLFHLKTLKSKPLYIKCALNLTGVNDGAHVRSPKKERNAYFTSEKQAFQLCI